MIDNVILLITGTLRQRPMDELVLKCHPLGSFEQMEAVSIAPNPAELFNAILVDTPLGMFVHSFMYATMINKIVSYHGQIYFVLFVRSTEFMVYLNEHSQQYVHCDLPGI